MDKISIALCTYNGAKYLKSQLESIAAQTRLPDEMMVCDDGSTDETLSILKAFAATARFSVHIERNEKNLGYAKNFEKAISQCTGDIIFLSDQDDVWHFEKIQRIASAFEKEPGIGGVFTNAEVVNHLLHPMGFTTWEMIGFSKRKQTQFKTGRAFELLLRRNMVTGATLAFRTDLRKTLLPIPHGWVHDAWIALLISGISILDIIDEPMIQYRQHGSNQIGAEKKGIFARIDESLKLDRTAYYHSDIQCYQAAYMRLLPYLNLHRLNLMEEKLRHLHLRSRLPANRLVRIPLILKEFMTLKYHRYSRSWQVAMRDMLIP